MGRASEHKRAYFLYDWAADEDSKPKVIDKMSNGGRLTSAALHSSATVSAADTNYNTFSLIAGSDTIATLANGPASGGVDITAAGGAMTLNATPTFEVDELLKLQSTKTGSGLAVADLSVSIEFTYDD